MNAVRGVGAVGAVMVIGALAVLMGGRGGWTPAVDARSDAGGAPPATEPTADLVPIDVLAARTVDRLLLFRTGHGSASMTLGSDEVTALLTESLPGLLPAGVEDVEVVVRDGSILLRAQVVTEEWVGTRRLRPVMVALPDTVRAEVHGDLVRIGRRLGLRVSAARAHGVPLPGAIVDALVAELPMSVTQAEGPILQVNLPEGIGDVRVVGDRLILYATEPFLQRAVDGQDDG